MFIELTRSNSRSFFFRCKTGMERGTRGGDGGQFDPTPQAALYAARCAPPAGDRKHYSPIKFKVFKLAKTRDSGATGTAPPQSDHLRFCQPLLRTVALLLHY